MWKISHRISGDGMIASLEDNYSDLCIAALESINGFHKKTGKTVDEMFEMKLFDQYTKTCLWTMKARKGVRLTDRMPFRNKHFSIDAMMENRHSQDDLSFDIPDTSSGIRFSRVDAKDLYDTFGNDLKKLVNILATYPEVMTAEGNIKVDPIAKMMKIPSAKVIKLIKSMEDTNE